MTTLKTIAAFIIAIGIMGCDQGYSKETYDFDEPVSLVSVNTDMGDVIVEKADSFENTSVSVELDCETVTPDYELYVDNDELIFDLTVDGGATACDAVVQIRTSSLAVLDIRTGRGQVSIRAMEGEAKIVNYDGDVNLDNVSGDLDITVVSGDITGVDVRSPRSNLTVGAGEVELTYIERPEDLDVDILSGGTTITVPSDSYRLDATTDAGSVQLEGIVEDSSSSNTLYLSTDAGDITVRGQ